MSEGYREFVIRWYLYRRWKSHISAARKANVVLAKLLMSTPKGGLFLDLGANVGNVTGWAVERGLRVVAFEPDPVALAVLRNRFAHHPRVKIVPNAIGATSRTAQFYRKPDVEQNIGSTIGSSLFNSIDKACGPTITVEVTNIIKFIQDVGEPVAIIKMDIEGAEAECLEAILDAGIHTRVGQILVETHERFSQDLSSRIETLRNRIKREKIDNIDLGWI